jgi:hypothetical protein
MLCNGNECGKAKSMRISIQPSPVLTVIDQKQPKSLEYFRYLGSMIAKDARCTRGIKSINVIAKAGLNKKKAIWT